MKIKPLFIGIFCVNILFDQASAAVRIKDIASVGGGREIELIGYGLVTGLNGTGDKAGTNPTNQSLGSMLKKMGINVAPENLTSNNVAAVAVMARAPVFSSVGGFVDATVSSLGNASSLEGGTLLLTPLMASNGTVVASAQGKIQLDGTKETKDRKKMNLTVGTISSGVIIEQAISAPVVGTDNFILVRLHEPDFVTAERVAEAISSSFGTPCVAEDATRIKVPVIEEFKEDPVGYVARIESTSVEPDDIARVVINEKTGTVISGKDVRISAVAISHGDLEINVSGRANVMLPDSASVTTMVSMLTAVGATPADIATIFKALKKAGALNAQLVIM